MINISVNREDLVKPNFHMFHLMTHSFDGTSISPKSTSSENFDTDDEFREPFNKESNEKNAIPNFSKKRSLRHKNSRLFSCNNQLWVLRKDKKTLLLGAMYGEEVLTIKEFADSKNKELKFKEITQVLLSQEENLLIVVLDNRNILMLQILVIHKGNPVLKKKIEDFLNRKSKKKLDQEGEDGSDLEVPIGKSKEKESMGEDRKDPMLKAMVTVSIICGQIKGLVKEKAKIFHILWSSSANTFFYSVEGDIKRINVSGGPQSNEKKDKTISDFSIFSGKSNITCFDVCELSKLIFFVNLNQEIVCINQQGRILRVKKLCIPIINLKTMIDTEAYNKYKEERESKTSEKSDRSSTNPDSNLPDTYTETSNLQAFEYIILLLNNLNIQVVSVSKFQIQEKDVKVKNVPTRKFITSQLISANENLSQSFNQYVLAEYNDKTTNAKWNAEMSHLPKGKGEDIQTIPESKNKELFSFYENQIFEKSRKYLYRAKIWYHIKMYSDDNDLIIVFLRTKLMIRICFNFACFEEEKLKGIFCI